MTTTTVTSDADTPAPHSKLGPQYYSLVGSQGVALVIYTLRKLGHSAMEAGEGLPFDVLTIVDGRPVRIQVKSTQGADAKGRYSFMTARGRYAVKTLHAVPLTAYSGVDVDVVACAALPLERVVFVPVAKITGTSLVIPECEFTKAFASAGSLTESLKELQKT